MLFLQKQYLDQIRRGEKRATIRPWRTCRLQRGDALTFSGGLRVTLTRVTLCQLRDVTADQIAADGFASRAAFLRAYRAHYPGNRPADPCCVLEFRSPHVDRQRPRSARRTRGAKA